jgi:hypothetical protein
MMWLMLARVSSITNAEGALHKLYKVVDFTEGETTGLDLHSISYIEVKPILILPDNPRRLGIDATGDLKHTVD